MLVYIHDVDPLVAAAAFRFLAVRNLSALNPVWVRPSLIRGRVYFHTTSEAWTGFDSALWAAAITDVYESGYHVAFYGMVNGDVGAFLCAVCGAKDLYDPGASDVMPHGAEQRLDMPPENWWDTFPCVHPDEAMSAMGGVYDAIRRDLRLEPCNDIA